jgi:hypothetical protein
MYRLELIKKAMSAKGHEIYVTPFKLNIVGVRTIHDKVNFFNDYFYCFYNDQFGVEHLITANGFTTKPGLHWLVNLLNPNGSAILFEGQYKDVYMLGLHQGKYEALVQRGGPVTVIRDNNRDNKHDYDKTRESGYFGINIHRANAYSPSTYVGKWSAGCQVFSDPSCFNKLMALVKKYNKQNKNRFTYTLINEMDVLNEIPANAIGIDLGKE